MFFTNPNRNLAYAALVLVIVGGCVCPSFPIRSEISGDIVNRTGFDLGPSKPAADTVIADDVDFSNGLSEEEAISVGLWNNPAYQELLADLQITHADIIEAAQLRNPQINTMLPIGVKQWELALLIPLDAIRLRPIRLAAAELESKRVADRLVQDGLDVVRDIRVAYANWRLAVQLAELAERGAKLRKEVARIAEARLKAGDVGALDVSAIRLDALVGASEAVRASANADLARQRLRYLLGLQLSNVKIKPVADQPFDFPDGVDVEQLVEEAIASRPDLRAVELAVMAAEHRAAFAERDVWRLSAMLPDLNSKGRKGFEAGPGLQFNLPIFHQNQGAIARASADAERLRRQFENRRQLAATEVKQAYTQLLQAQKDWDIWHKHILPQAEEAVQSSGKALEENAVSLLLVLETTRQFLTAQQREKEADAQLRRAQAELERSVGKRLVDIQQSDHAGDETLPPPQAETRTEEQ